ncbi:MAG: hemerythrin domain-containing protein [Candidatus Anstonellales archaeon]
MEKNNKNSISLFMVKDHAIVYSFLHEYIQEKNLQRKVLARRRFLRLLWRLKTHFDWEELLLFPLVNKKYSKTINRLKKEHKIIMKLLKSINEKTENDDFNTEKEDEKLQTLLKNHSTLEDNDIYPKLDKEIPEKERKLLLDKMTSQIATDY